MNVLRTVRPRARLLYASPSKITLRQATSASQNDVKSAKKEHEATPKAKAASTTGKSVKTMAQMDEEMRKAMEGRAGDGGDAGVELEDGKPVAMKRGVRDNMFRYI